MTTKVPVPRPVPSLSPVGTATLDLTPLAPAEGPESVEQSKLRAALDRAGLLWCHVPNGELRDPVVAARLCSQGVKTGVPDVMIYSRPPAQPWASARGVALELKVRGGRVSPDQRRWHDLLGREGWIVGVCWSAAEGIRFLEQLGFVIPPEPEKPAPKRHGARKRADAGAVLARLERLEQGDSSC